MTVHTLFCTLCSKNFHFRLEWNQHLTQDLHQSQACAELGRWKKERRKSLIVYCSGKLIRGGVLLEGILRWLEETGGKCTFVSNLVLSPNGRYKTAVVQLESRRKVNQIMEALENMVLVRIESQVVQMKRLESMQELEWSDFLECFLGINFNCKKETWFNFATPVTRMPKLVTPVATASLQIKFSDLLQSLEIPVKEISQVQEVMQTIKRVLEESLPPCEIGLYRNHFLGLRNNPWNVSYLVLIFLQKPQKKKDFPTIFRTMAKPLENYIANSDSFRIVGPRSRHPEKDITTPAFLNLIHLPSGISLVCSSKTVAAAEYQLSKLSSYYCLFDARVKPLLNLLYFWIKLNSVSLSKSKPELVTSRTVPDPVGLEWMLLFFLYHAEKLIPVPREILKKTEKPFCVEGPLKVGFNFDANCAADWCSSKKTQPPSLNSEEFFVSVLSIFWKFTVLFGTSLEMPCVLESISGKVWTMKEHGHSDSAKQCGRCDMLQNLVKDHTGNGEVCNLMITHPLITRSRWKLSVDKDKWAKEVRPALRVTATKLEAFIKNLGSGICNASFEDALNVRL